MFQTLPLMFETQYNELALAVDLLAERIRALGFPTPATYSEFARLSSIKETAGVPKAEEMNNCWLKARNQLFALHVQFLRWLKRLMTKQRLIF